MAKITIKVKKIDPKLDNPLPFYVTRHSSGMDLTSASKKDIIIEPMTTELVPTNLVFEIPHGYEGQVRPRSGLALKHSIGIINSPGTIDADYRGEVKILLTNFGRHPFTVKFGERIAQMVISKTEQVKIEVTDEVSDTQRSSGGFGHTGK
jgi:dUTP pyrophosphatase